MNSFCKLFGSYEQQSIGHELIRELDHIKELELLWVNRRNLMTRMTGTHPRLLACV